MDDWDSGSEAGRRGEIAGHLARAIPSDGALEPHPGLWVYRASTRIGPIHGVARPSFCVVAQGAKEVFLGESRYGYDPHQYLIATLDLPVIGQITRASPDEPYLALRLDLDPGLVASVALEAGLPAERGPVSSGRGIETSALGGDLLEATIRLARLAHAPVSEARMLLPLVTKEIVFRLLTGEAGSRLRQIAVPGGHADRISHAVARLRRDFDKPLRVELLAREIGMSPSSLHEHFKAITALSPLQFQKQLRLQEARRMLLAGNMDASGAGHRVGYGDASQFSKEYKRLFGVTPMRDIARLRQGPEASSAA